MSSTRRCEAKEIEGMIMTYSRIADLPEDAGRFESSELRALGEVWKEKRAEQEKTGVFQEFLKKMQREWAIETGIIERLYVWDRGVTEVLIQHGIDSSNIAHESGMNRMEAEHAKAIIDDQLEIVEGLFSHVKGEQPLTEHFIRGLQAQFTEHQDGVRAVTPNGRETTLPLDKGRYKTLPNNPRKPDGDIHEYCPPELVIDEMQQLIQGYRKAEGRYGSEVLAAWFHHGFTHIHPFQDGNGRVARALASLVFLKAGLFPLVLRNADRDEYIDALEEADRGDLGHLVSLFAKRQRESILGAIGLQQQVEQANYVDHIISSAVDVLKVKCSDERRKSGRVYEVAGSLMNLASERLTEVSKQLNDEIEGLTPPGHDTYQARVAGGDVQSERAHYFYNQIIDIANQFNYFANLDRYRAWIKLAIVTDGTFEYVISFHGYGHNANGIMAVSSFTTQRIPREDGGTEPVNIRPAAVDLFQFNYIEPEESTKSRYSEWLESSLAIALAEWQRQLSA